MMSKLEFKVTFPQIVSDLITDLPTEGTSVTVKEGSDKPLNISSEAGQFYVGKMYRKTVSDRVKAAIGFGQRESSIYSEEYVAESLAFLFKNLEPGQRAKFVIVRSVSEIINGQSDVEGVLTVSEQKALIYKIALKKFGKTEADLEVVNLEEDLLHREIFVNLRGALAEEKSPLDALDQDVKDLNINSSSLDIAQFLFKVTEKSDHFLEIVKALVPEKLKDKIAHKNWAYGIVELGIRLKEILAGRNTHGGPKRQLKYDYIIRGILAGNKGNLKNIIQLQPLFDLFKNKKYSSVYVLEENCFSFQKKRSMALKKLISMTALSIAAVIGESSYVDYRMRQADVAQQRAEAYKVAAAMGDMDKFSQSNEPLVEVVTQLITALKAELMARYEIDNTTMEELAPLMRQFMVNHKKEVYDITCNEMHGLNSMKQISGKLTNSFVWENQFILREKGIDVSKSSDMVWGFAVKYGF